MPYEIRYTDFANKGSITVEDETVNTETSLSIPGKKRKDYGQLIGENFLQLLENFAASSAPDKPIEGQLWYDTTDGVDQLKVYDGTTWTAAGGVKKANTAPAVSNSVVGDLWVNTQSQQLYLFSGSGWVLVGPEFSDGLLTGTQAQTLIGTDDVEYSVLTVKIQDTIVAIISPTSFIPKSNIAGFSGGLRAGINLSTSQIYSGQTLKYYGTSEKSENLVIGDTTVAASNFLRSDQESTTNHRLNIKNNNGVVIGDNGQLTINVSSGVGVLQHNVSGSSIDFRLRSGNRSYNVVRVDSTQRVGINNSAPEQDLHVTGNVLISPKTGTVGSGFLQIDSTVNSDSLDTGSIVTSGGAAIALDCNIGGDLQVTGSSQTGDILPDTSGTRSIGTVNRKYNQIHALTVYGNLQGNVTGSVTGRSSSADKLTSATTFSISGDVVPASFAFDGQTGGTTKTFNVQITNSFVSNKTATFDAGNNDEILLNKTSGNTGLYRISKQNFLKTLQLTPVGLMSPYGGLTAPVGWLLCDGTVVSKTDYPLLWEVIGHSFKDPATLADQGLNTFALPDFRGRFPLGKDNMGGTSANRVTNTAADTVGESAGSESTNIGVSNLPEHTHDLQGSDGSQFYAIRESSATPVDPNTLPLQIESGAGGTQGLSNSGGVNSGTLGQSLNIMNPYLTINFIIYTGQ